MENLLNRLDEVPMLKRHRRIAFWVTLAMILSTFAISYMQLPISVDHIHLNAFLIFSTLVMIFFLKILPFEMKSGPLRWTFRGQELLFGLSFGVLTSFTVLFTGGIHSPFWYIYIMVPIGTAINLPSWAVLIEVIEAIVLYLFTVLVGGPFLYNTPISSNSYSTIAISLSGIIFSSILAYHLAEDIMKDNKQKYELAVTLDKRSKEINVEKNKFYTILSSINDGVLVLNTSHMISFGNKEMEKISDRNVQELIGKDITSLGIQTSDGQVLTNSFIFDTKNHTNNSFYYIGNKLQIIKKNGEKNYLSLTALKVDEGELLDIDCICVVHDITTEMQKDDTKLDFVSMAAHELRTPLTIIRGYSALLIQKSKNFDSETIDFINRLEVSSRNLADLIDNLLSVSRIEHNTFKIEKIPVNLRKTIVDIVRDLQEQAKIKNQNLELFIPDSLPFVIADELRIRQVLVNLIANSINYTQVNGHITVTVTLKDSYLSVSVTDTGVGIPQEALPKLFTKFFRVSGQLEQGSKGNGLGLFICKSIIEMHNGKISVNSEYGKGTTFMFELPVASIEDIAKFRNTISQSMLTDVSRKGIIINKELGSQYTPSA